MKRFACCSIRENYVLTPGFSIIEPILLATRLDNIQQTALSLDNLMRLGLISIPFDTYFSNDEVYNIFQPILESRKYNTQAFRLKQHTHELLAVGFSKEDILTQDSSIDSDTFDRILNFSDNNFVSIDKKIVKLTEFGKAFISVCFSNND